MKKKKDSLFWISYSDLMTSLFLIMLALFMIVFIFSRSSFKIIGDLREQVDSLQMCTDSLGLLVQTTEAEWQKVKDIQKSTRDIEGDYFSYNERYEKFVMNIKCKFDINKYDINLLEDSTRQQLKAAGDAVCDFLKKHGDNKYLFIIEGQASKDNAGAEYNYNLSFQRALGLTRYWSETCGICFPENCELQIAGSGDGTLNVVTMREVNEEENQRFLIYIIPKNILKDEN